jgi:hypothetical protein
VWRLAISIDWNSCAMDDTDTVTAQEQDYLGDILGLWPGCKIGTCHHSLLFTSVSIILGRIEFTRTPVSFTSAANESIIATAAAFDAA